MIALPGLEQLDATLTASGGGRWLGKSKHPRAYGQDNSTLSDIAEHYMKIRCDFSWSPALCFLDKYRGYRNISAYHDTRFLLFIWYNWKSQSKIRLATGLKSHSIKIAYWFNLQTRSFYTDGIYLWKTCSTDLFMHKVLSLCILVTLIPIISSIIWQPPCNEELMAVCVCGLLLFEHCSILSIEFKSKS